MDAKDYISLWCKIKSVLIIELKQSWVFFVIWVPSRLISFAKIGNGVLWILIFFASVLWYCSVLMVSLSDSVFHLGPVLGDVIYIIQCGDNIV